MSDVSCTLDVKCKDGAIRNQAGMAVVETGKGFYSPSDCTGTLESNEDQHRRNIICAGFMGGQGAKAGGIGFGEQTSPTIKASPSGGNQIPDVVLSLAAAQTGELGCIGENISQTLSRNNGGFSYIAAVKNGETEKKEPDVVCVHGSQDPICNKGHANAVNRNNGLENVICRATQQGNAECYENFSYHKDTGNRNGKERTVVCYNPKQQETGIDHDPTFLYTLYKEPHLVGVIQSYSIGNGQAGELNAMQKEVSKTLHCMHDQQLILGFDGYNQKETGNVSKSITSCASDYHHVPCIFWNGENVASTITEEFSDARMPDKGKLPCVISKHSEAVAKQQNYICYENHAQDCWVKELKDGVFQQINAKAGMGGGNLPLVQEAYAFDAFNSNSMKSANPASGCRKINCAKTLDTSPIDPNKNQGGMVILAHDKACYPINSMVIGKDAKDGDRQTTGIGNDKDPSPTIGTSQHHAVAIAENIIGRKVENGGNGIGAQEELAYTQNATGVMGVYTKGNGDAFLSEVHTTVSTGGGCPGQGYPACIKGMSVRRILPIETERLMGFPDVDILEIGKMTKDEFIAWELASGNITVDFSTGKVFSCRTGGGKQCPPHELEGTVLNGYKVVSIREKGIIRQCRIHRIVWIAAHGIIPEGYVVDHINNDKQDNRISNLHLLTPKENSTKAAKDGLYLTGEDHPKTKLTDEQKNDIITLYETEYHSVRRLAAMYGVSKSRIHQLVKNQGWTQIPWKGKPAEECPDAPRYKACGNSFCVNVVRWIGIRIQAVEDAIAKENNKSEEEEQ